MLHAKDHQPLYFKTKFLNLFLFLAHTMSTAKCSSK